jgi:hypothetical protein
LGHFGSYEKEREREGGRERPVGIYSLCFKINVTFGHKLRYEIKVKFGEISLKLRPMDWNVVIHNVNVDVDKLPR